MSGNSSYDPVIPTETDARAARQAGRILAAHDQSELRMHLDDGRTLVLPAAAARILARLLDEMANGNAVTLIPLHAEMTTQDAADFLNVSRPHLISLLERGDIPFHRVGTHRRVRVEDVKTYKERVTRQRNETLDELARVSQDLGLGY